MPAPDLTDQYNTALSAGDETKYEAWAKTLPARLNDTKDYDLRGAWKAGADEAANGHLPDTYKKPNHPTFSDESEYSGQGGNVGGKWAGDDKAGWSFTPSTTNLKNMTPDELKGYFSKVEPTSKLNLPDDTSSRADKRYGAPPQ